MGGLIAYLNRALGTNVSREQCTCRASLHRAFGFDDGRAFKRGYVRRYRKETRYLDVGPIDGAPETVCRLAEQGDIVLLTAREPEILEVTPGWLREHLPDLTDYKLVSANAAGTSGYVDRPSKLEVVQALDAACLIDDNADEFRAWPAHEGAPLAVCFAQPWNAWCTESCPRVFRGSWPEIVERLSR